MEKLANERVTNSYEIFSFLVVYRRESTPVFIRSRIQIDATSNSVSLGHNSSSSDSRSHRPQATFVHRHSHSHWNSHNFLAALTFHLKITKRSRGDANYKKVKPPSQQENQHHHQEDVKKHRQDQNV
jgi:hypothetical protein